MQIRCSAKHGRVENLMGDGISPHVQIFQLPAPQAVIRENGIYLWPEGRYSQSAEVATDGPLIRILYVKLPIPQQVAPHGNAETRVRNYSHKKFNRLRVQVASKTLKLR